MNAIRQGDVCNASNDPKNSLSAKVKVKLQEKAVNATLDTGAGPSVIDIGSCEHIGLADAIKKPTSGLVNASGDSMDVIGVVNIDVKIPNMRCVTHEFKVINTRSFKNILLGRDFMKRFKRVTFDFDNNRVKLGAIWVTKKSLLQGVTEASGSRTCEND